MSWTDQELAEMARASHAEQKFAYHDSYFAEVDKMLGKKKKPYFPFILLPLIPLMAIFSYLLVYGKVFIEPISVAKTVEKTQRSATWVAENSTPSKTITSQKQLETLKSSIQENAPREQKLFGNRIKQTPLIREITSTLPKKLAAELVNFGGEFPVSESPDFTTLTGRGSEVLPTSNEQWEIGELKLRKYQRHQSNLNKEIAGLTPYVKSNLWRPFIEVGAGMGESYLNAQVGHTRSLYFGGGYRYDFKRTYVQFALLGEMQKVQLEISERAKIYHTSVTEYENVFNYQNLYRLQAPLTIAYKISQHSVQFTLSPTYLLGAKMKYAYKENGTTMQSTITYAERKGWNNFSSNLSLGYAYQLPKNVFIGASVNWQMMNQINRKIVSSGANRPFSGQVFLRKILNN